MSAEAQNTKCCRKVCTSGKEGILCPVIKVWAKGYEKAKSVPLEMLMKGLFFCEDCAANLRPADLLTADGKEKITKSITMAGRVAPDFDGAELEMIQAAELELKLRRPPERKQAPNPPDKYGRGH
jgi:hypothetical protein